MDSTSLANAALLERFGSAFNDHDIEVVMGLMTEDCVFENTNPAPDGTRYEGQAAVRAAFSAFFDENPRAIFETEEMFASETRGFVCWIYRWDDAGGHVRGVDVFHFRGGRVAAKLSYVKG